MIEVISKDVSVDVNRDVVKERIAGLGAARFLRLRIGGGA